jgi:hypothetical protein
VRKEPDADEIQAESELESVRLQVMKQVVADAGFEGRTVSQHDAYGERSEAITGY